MRIKKLAPAKINLYLEVGEKTDNFHKIVSLVEIISLYDEIYFSPSHDVKVEFIPDYGIPQENTVTKAVSLLKEKFCIKKGIDIKIFKNIPPASGLGGGSSNAACVLESLCEIWDIDLEESELYKLGAEIGSDVPLFLYGKRCVVEGRGEKITPLDFKSTLWYFILTPPFPVSTHLVYNYYDKMGLKGDLTKAKEEIKILIEFMKEGNIKMMENIIYNKLGEVSEGIWKEIKEFRIYMEKKTGKKFFISGSGGAIFSVFKEKPEEILLAPGESKWKSFLVKSLN